MTETSDKGGIKMACFLVPTTEAVIAGVSAKRAKKNEEKHSQKEGKIPFSIKLGWLFKMSSLGSALLMFEHIWHGEVVPFFPFLTNAANPQSRAEMFHEMATTGVLMAVLVTFVWLGMLAVVHFIETSEMTEEKTN